MKKEMTVVILILLVVGGAYAYSQGFFRGVIPQAVVNGCTLILPQFGTIACEQLSEETYSSPQAILADGITVKCGDTENTPQCALYVAPDYIFLNPSVNLYYSINNQLEQCKNLVADGNYITLLSANTYKLGTTVKIRMTVGGTCGFDTGLIKGTGKYQESFIPYGLIVYDSGKKERYNVKSCAIGDLQFYEQNNLCSDGDCQKTIQGTTIGFHDWVNYLSSYMYAPIDDNNKIATYQGQQVYCQYPALYSVNTFTVKSGACYSKPNQKIADLGPNNQLKCCPGMQTYNGYCDDNFQWVINQPPQCTNDLNCPGQGNYITDPSQPTPTIVKYSCQSSKCVVVDTKQVDCVPPNVGCQSGYVCDVNKGYVCVKQEGPGVICGDKVCSSPYENEINCPVDCGGVPRNIPWDLVFAGLAGLIAFAMSGGIKKLKEEEYDGLVIAIVLAILMSLVTWWVVNNYITIFAGIGILAILGGAALYFFGFVFIVIAWVLGKIVRGYAGED